MKCFSSCLTVRHKHFSSCLTVRHKHNLLNNFMVDCLALVIQRVDNSIQLVKCTSTNELHLTPVVQRADNFIHWISRYPAEQIYTNQCFCKVFHTIPFLNLTYASTLFTNYKTIMKILHTFYLPDSELFSG